MTEMNYISQTGKLGSVNFRRIYLETWKILNWSIKTFKNSVIKVILFCLLLPRKWAVPLAMIFNIF